MNYEELYERIVSNNDIDAFKEIEAEAGSGNAEAQFVLSCIYDDVTSPFKNIALGMYWLKQSADNGNRFAQEKLEEMPVETKMKYDIASEEEINTYFPDGEDVEPGGLFSMKGRINRKKYSIHLLIVFAIHIAWGFLFLKLIDSEGIPSITQINADVYADHPSVWFMILAGLVVEYLYFVLFAKRLHDAGHACYFAILSPFASIFKLILAFSLFYLKTQQYTNEYGPVPDKK